MAVLIGSNEFWRSVVIWTSRSLVCAHAADVLWTYSAAELYELLVLRRRWSVKRYAAFAVDAMCAALL